jgi:hypothetical protein
VLKNVFTCDGKWIFQYDLEMKKQLIHWKTPTSPRMGEKKQWIHVISVSQKLMCPIQFQPHLVFLDLPNGIFWNKVEK